MKFALINGDKKEAQTGLQGICINCHSEMVAKCGSVNIWHWAHKSKLSCDLWWENETPWHREWKNQFPKEYQEISHVDPATEERHIADIKTTRGFVVEFQHSAIDLVEVKSREAFYKNMVWIVDATRLTRDYKRFCKGFDLISPSIKPGFFLSYPEECFHPSWLSSSVPVYFDFQGVNPPEQSDEMRDLLWGLFPGRVDRHAVITKIPRKKFIEFSLTNPNLLLAQDILFQIAQHEQQQREEQKWRENQRAEAFRQFWKNPGRGMGRF